MVDVWGSEHCDFFRLRWAILGCPHHISPIKRSVILLFGKVIILPATTRQCGNTGLFYARNHPHLSTDYQGGGTLVISARVFHGGELFVILSWVYQSRDTGHLGTDVSRRNSVARRNCQMPPLLDLPSPMFSVAFEHHIFSHFPSISFPARRP